MLNSSLTRRRRIPGACDTCKKKKIKCDSGERMGRPCTNCEIAGIDCTHKEMTKALGPAKSYVANLEMRLEKMERILHKFLPGVDLNGDLDKLAGVPEAHYGSPSPSSLDSPEPCGLLPRNDDEDEDEDESQPYHMLCRLKKLQLNPDPAVNRFFGRSSGIRLVQTALDLKCQYIGQSLGRDGATISPPTRKRDEFWAVAAWQKSKLNEKTKTDPSSIVFPDDDLIPSLIDCYFKEVNIFYPLLHRPTFERQIGECLHRKDSIFGNVLLLVCALGAKYSDDPRVFTEGSDTTRSAGHRWFAQVDYGRKPFGLKPTLYELQVIALIVIFAKSSGIPQGEWVLIGLGLRMAQEIGVHRRRLRKNGHVDVEDELWKRAFWVLLAMDRIVSTVAGRPCASHEEDYDQDYPIECDDEYWGLPDSPQSFQQPPDKPSTMSFFICFLRLMEILDNVIRLVYPYRRSTFAFERVGFKSEQQVITELDSTMNRWMDCIPEHLRWNSNQKNILFLKQSAALYLAYYNVEISIHRPFIPSLRNPSAMAFPSLTICTNAARSCCYIIDTLSRSNVRLIPHFQAMAVIATLVLLVNIWNNRRSGVTHNCRRELELVQKVLDMLSHAEQRWTYAGRARDLIVEISSLGDAAYCKCVTLDRGLGPGRNKGSTTIPPMNERDAGIPYGNRLAEYRPGSSPPQCGNTGQAIFNANVYVEDEPVTPQSNFAPSTYINGLGVGRQHGSEMFPPVPGAVLEGPPLFAPGPVYASTTGVGVEGYQDQNYPSTFQGQDRGQYVAQPMPGQESGWESQEADQIAQFWQMMDMDNMGIWITSASEYEWENYLMSVDQTDGHGL